MHGKQPVFAGQENLARVGCHGTVWKVFAAAACARSACSYVGRVPITDGRVGRAVVLRAGGELGRDFVARPLKGKRIGTLVTVCERGDRFGYGNGLGTR